MTELVFVDANVIVYSRDPRDPRKQQRAAAWLDRLWRDQSGRISIQVLSEYYVTVTRKLHPGLTTADAWDDVCALLCWNPQIIDEAALRRSREIEQRLRLSWWDSLIVAAAELQGCALILSEDFQDGGVYGSVTVRSPFALSADEPLTEYATRIPVVGHRRRGRPKKSTAVPDARP